MKKVYHKLFYLIGIFCTMNIVSIGGMAIYNYLIIILLFIRVLQILLEKKKEIYLSSKNILWYVFFLIMFLSVLHASFSMPIIWVKESLSLTLKFSIYILGLIILFGNTNLLILKKSFISGLYMSTILQLLWGGLQAGLWYGVNLNLNEIIFGDILNVNKDNIDWQGDILGSIIRLTGFSWEPANFALVMLIGWSLSKSSKMKFLFILALIFSYSKTGWLCMCILGMLKFIIEFKNINLIKIISLNNIIKFLVFIFIFMVFAIVYSDLIQNTLNTIGESFIILQNAIFTDEDYSSNIHKSYYIMLGDILNNMSLWQCIFGYGTFSAGYPYGLYNIVPYGTDWVWNPESDFITIIIGNGILGIIVYYLIIIKAYFYINNIREKYILISIVVCGITYLFIRGTWSCLILFFLSITQKKNERE